MVWPFCVHTLLHVAELFVHPCVMLHGAIPTYYVVRFHYRCSVSTLSSYSKMGIGVWYRVSLGASDIKSLDNISICTA